MTTSEQWAAQAAFSSSPINRKDVRTRDAELFRNCASDLSLSPELRHTIAVRELAQSIQKHWSGVVAFLKTRLTNGAIEAVNGLLQLAKRLARGFRSLRYFRIMAYLKAAGLHLDLPA